MTRHDRRHHQEDAAAADGSAAHLNADYPASPPPSGVQQVTDGGGSAPTRPAQGESPWTGYATSPYPVNPEADAPEPSLADPDYRPPDYAREPTPAHGVTAQYPPSPTPGTSWYARRPEPTGLEPEADPEPPTGAEPTTGATAPPQ